MGGLAPREDGVKGRREKEGYRGQREREEHRDEIPWRTREPRETEIERAIQGRREEERTSEKERERRERTRLGAMCIGERIHIVRFGGKVFGQVQGDAAAGSLLFSPSSLSYRLVFSRLVSTPLLFLSLSFSLFRLCPSGLLVSFRFSSLRISLWCARGDLGA